MQVGLIPAQFADDEEREDARTDKASRHVLAPKDPLTVRKEDAFITFFPEETHRITYGIDEKEAEVIGKQWFCWAPAEDQHYRWQIAPARSYAPSLQVRSSSTSFRPCLSVHLDRLVLVGLDARRVTVENHASYKCILIKLF